MLQKFKLFCFFALFANFSLSQTITTTFNYTGNSQQWTVPGCVNTITVTLAGASGGGDYGGQGASLSGTLNVTSGQTLIINVGGQGNLNNGGFNGGGDGSTANQNSNYSFGGGGASDIRTSNNLADRLVVAAGGGGTGGGSTDAEGGFGGCVNGTFGLSPFGFGGDGASQNSGGNGGPPWNNSGNTGNSGGLGFGGDGANDPCHNLGPGGGGGGGYYGGGGGGSDCYPNYPLGGGGGGGGSSLIPAGFTCNENTNSGNGYITIEYTSENINNPVVDLCVNSGSLYFLAGFNASVNDNSGSWSGPGNLFANSAGVYNSNNHPEGIYTYTIQDGNGCQINYPVQVNNPPATPTINTN